VKADFLIIGGGVIGLTSAQFLLLSGYRVTLIERGKVGQEASWAGGGILSPLCPWDYQEAVTRLALRGMDMFCDAAAMLHAATGIDPEYQRGGMLLLPPFQQEIAEQWCAQHRFVLRPVRLADHLPAQQGRQYQGTGLLLPEIAQVRNPRLLHALRDHVVMLGGVVLEHHEMQKFELAGTRITGLQTIHGKLDADTYIVAAGAWSKALLGEHALGLDIRPIRGQILLFKFDVLPFRQILLKENLYFIPRRDGHVLVGSTLEDVGFDKSATVEARESLLQRIREIFPEWHDQVPVKHWAGFRPSSPDNIPTIGRHPYVDNLFVNSGHFRYGVTMSLASAELLRNVIEGLPQPIPVEEYCWRL
jgi:glycine oxidase